jgi:transcriptional regulator CtsR
MRMSDLITQRILQMLDESADNITEIQRNEFAALMGCVPSQINYVLSSRFTPEHGYIIESRRGGGGYIKIKRIMMNHSSALMHIINSIGFQIDSLSARVLLENCIQSELITVEQGRLMFAAISNQVLGHVVVEHRDRLRAALLKEMLLSLV